MLDVPFTAIFIGYCNISFHMGRYHTYYLIEGNWGASTDVEC